MAVATSPESLAVQKNRTVVCKLIVACADTSWFAGRLVEESFITSQVQANVARTRGMSDYEKCSQLLDAVEVQLIIDPRKFQAFLEVFSDQPALQAVADALRQSCDCCGRRLVVRQLSHDSDSSASPPESAISIPECNIQFSLFITELTPLLENHEGALSNILTFLEQLVLPLHNKCLAKIFQPEKFQGVQSIRDLFRLLAPHWGYIDCSLLHPIVKASSCKPALAKVEEFLHNREQLSQALIIQKAEKHQPSSECNTTPSSSDRVSQDSHQLPAGRSQSPRVTMQQASAHEEVVQMKVETNAMTLKDYEENVSLLSHILRLPRYVMSFFSSGTGSISLKWLMSKRLVSYVQNTRICTSDLIALAEKHVTEIKVGSVYQITIPPVAYWQEGTILSGETLLLMASFLGHTHVVDMLLKAGANPNIPNEDGVTALMAAAINGRASACTLLIKRGAHVDCQNNSGQTPLWTASFEGHTHLVDMLLKAGANPNILKKDGATALMAAAQEGHTQAAAILVEGGAQVNLQRNSGETPLLMASFHGHTHLVDMFLKAGANPNIPKKDGATALMVAAQEGHLHTAAILVEGGAEVNLQRNDGATALMVAAQEGHLHTATILVEGGAQVNLQKNDGVTALMAAAGSGHASLCTLLIKRGAHVDCQDIDGDTALMAAARNGHASVCTLLIEREARVDCQDNDGRTALWMASSDGHTSVLEILLKAGGDLHIPNKDGATALMAAAQEGRTQAAAILVEGGAQVNLQRNDGETALMAAAKEGHASEGRTAVWSASFGGHSSVLEILLKAGGDLHIPKKNGSTPLIVAAQEGHPNTAALLIEGGARVDLQHNNGWTALFIASLHGHSTVVDVLLKSGAHVNIPTEEGLTPLIAAVKKGHTEVVKQLLHAQADTSMKENSTGWTALHFAANMGKIETVQLLLQHGVDATILDLNQLTALDIAEAHGQDAVFQELQLYIQQNVPTEVDVRPQQHVEDSHGKSTANEGHEEQIEDTQQQSNNEEKTIQPKATRDKAQKAGRFLMALFGRIEDTLLRNKAEKRSSLHSGKLQGSETPSSSGDSQGKKQIVVELVD